MKKKPQLPPPECIDGPIDHTSRAYNFGYQGFDNPYPDDADCTKHYDAGRAQLDSETASMEHFNV